MVSAFIQWSDKFLTGNRDVDVDHKNLFALLNDLYDKVQAGSSHGSLGSTIAALEDYIAVHFDREETLMKSCKYAGLNAHVAQHRKLSDQVLHYREVFENDPSNLDLTDFMGFLALWLSNHILYEDMKYVEALETV